MQLRVLVKDWKGGQIGEDGPFIYNEAPKSKSEADQAYAVFVDCLWCLRCDLSSAANLFRSMTITLL